MKTIKAAALIVLSLAVISCATISNPGPRSSAFQFALIGDLGYRPSEEPWVENLMEDLNKYNLGFVVHDGDLGSPPNGSCTNEKWALRLRQFQASANPLIYTPGDNEWTDCHPKQAPGFTPLERLSSLRAYFFQGEESFGKRKIALIRQSQGSDPVLKKYRENARWTMGGVTFLTLHVVGSNNSLGYSPAGDAEYKERNAADIAWLKEGFQQARESNSIAVMIIQQANIFPQNFPFPGKESNGFDELRSVLEKEVIAFGKPVVLVHGDSHYFRIDKPLGARYGKGNTIPAVENFTRVETFGTRTITGSK